METGYSEKHWHQNLTKATVQCRKGLELLDWRSRLVDLHVYDLAGLQLWKMLIFSCKHIIKEMLYST